MLVRNLAVSTCADSRYDVFAINLGAAASRLNGADGSGAGVVRVVAPWNQSLRAAFHDGARPDARQRSNARVAGIHRFGQQRHITMVLTIYRLILTPAALIAIVSGTTLFVVGEIADTWLILKLTLVATLVLCHALMGWMILLVQESSNRNIAPFCALIGAGTIILILSIIWVVLTKPF